MAVRKRFWPPIVAGALLLLAYWPTNWFLLAFVAPAPLLWELRSRSGWSAWRAGFSYGFVFMVGQFWWVLHLTQRWVGSDTLGLVPVILGSLISATLWFAPMGWLLSKCWSVEKPWLIPIVWSGTEIIRALCPSLAYPWGILGSTLSDAAPLIQLAWFGSVFAVSAWALIPSVIIASLLSGDSPNKVTRLGYGFALLGALSLFRFFVPVQGQPITVVAGQPGIDDAFDKSYYAFRRHHEISLAHIGDIIADARNRNARLLVLPEGANSSSRFPVEPEFSLDPRLPTLFGSHRTVAPGESYQSAYLADSGKFTFADKTRLVIFGEYVPGRNIIPFLDKFDLPSGDVLPAKKLSNLRSGDLRIAPVICFEALFPDLVYQHILKGADVEAIMSIDDWFEGTNAMEQLRSGSIFRAVEGGLPVVRSAQTGYTMVIDQRGRVLAQAPLDEMASVPATVRIKAEGAFLLFPLFPVASLLSIAYIAFVKKRAPETTSLERVDTGDPQ